MSELKQLVKNNVVFLYCLSLMGKTGECYAPYLLEKAGRTTEIEEDYTLLNEAREILINDIEARKLVVKHICKKMHYNDYYASLRTFNERII